MNGPAAGAAGVGLFLLWFVFIFVFAIGSLVFWIIALVDVVKIPDYQFRAAGTDKTVWVLVVALAQGIGGLVWWFAQRRKVRAFDGLRPPPPPGWYPGPSGRGVEWWDGGRWTGYRPPGT